MAPGTVNEFQPSQITGKTVIPIWAIVYIKKPSRWSFHIRMAPASEIAEKAINNTKYIGEMASVVWVDEYSMINADAFSKKSAARK